MCRQTSVCQVNMYFNVQLERMQPVLCSMQTSFQLTLLYFQTQNLFESI